MNFLESIKMAFTSLKINRMRSFLTMLGIIIGISAVITITTIGNSIQKTLTRTFNSLGSTTHSVYLEPKDEGGQWPDMEKGDAITLEMVYGLIEEHPDELTYSLSETCGKSNVVNEEGETFTAAVVGVTSNYFESFKKQIVKGRFISQRDCSEVKYSCFVSDVFCRQYFKDPDDAIGKTIKFELKSMGKIESFTIVGIMEYTDLEKNALKHNKAKTELEKLTFVYIPYDTLLAINSKTAADTEIDVAEIGWKGDCDGETAKKYIKDYFGKIYKNNERWKVTIYDMAEELKLINVILTVVTVAISVIAAISLVVGGVGVMNIMLVSILERTREIGVRKALGALNADIRRQFVIEAVVICLTGGLIGVILGIFNGIVLGRVAFMIINNMYAQYAEYISLSVSPSIPAIIISLTFSMITGLIFGYYPAKRAGNMDPIDALRYE